MKRVPNLKNSPSSSKSIKKMFIDEEENKPQELLGTAAMKSLNTHQGAWSNRSMWSLSEKRLVFTSKSDEVT